MPIFKTGSVEAARNIMPKLIIAMVLLLTGCSVYGENEMLGGNEYYMSVSGYDVNPDVKRFFVRIQSGTSGTETITADEIEERLQAFAMLADKTAKAFCKDVPVEWTAEPLILIKLIGAGIMYTGHQSGPTSPYIWEGGKNPPPRFYERLFYCKRSA